MRKNRNGKLDISDIENYNFDLVKLNIILNHLWEDLQILRVEISAQNKMLVKDSK